MYRPTRVADSVDQAPIGYERQGCPRAIETVFPVLLNHFAEISQRDFVCVVHAIIPPSTVRFAPVMYEDSGPATKATIAAISSTCP
jgi:hypothetical protein